MLGKISHAALPETLTRSLGEYYLGQARTEKGKGHLDAALALYDQLKETLKSLGSVKEALRKAQDPHTLADETLRAMMADAYFERGEVLKGLNLFAKARSSYLKAEMWGHDEAKQRLVDAVQLPSSGHSAPLNRSVLAKTAEEKSALVDYLFEKALLTLSSLDVSKKTSLFLVYAHDNAAHGEAKASTSKYLINNLSKIRGVTLYSDQTPIGQAYSSSVENLKEDGKLEDILTNQFCLLPAQVRADVKPVDKVIVCCSDVLGSYLKGQSYKAFCDELKKAYDTDREAYVKDNNQKGTPALREVVRKFSQEERYMADFHHVLTEMAFLEIRAAHLKGQHGIIPVSLTPNSYDYCLKDFIDSTTVRMEDPLRFDLQVKKGEEVYLNQGSHGVLFKVIERLLAGSNEAKTFLDKFWTGHSTVISRLNSDLNFGKLEFAKLLDGIFDGIRTAMHSQLASTLQQEHEQLQVFLADPRAALKEQYFAVLEQDEAFKETLKFYVEPRGKAILDGTDPHKAETSDLLSKVQAFLKDKVVQVILLTGDSGAGKTTFNRRLEKHLWDNKKEDDAMPLFISLPSIDKPEHDLIAKALKKRGLSELQIQKLKKNHNQRFVFILDGYDEIRQTQNLYLSNGINQSDGWQGQMVISCRSEYLGQDYRSRFQSNPDQQGEASSFQEVVVEPFSKDERTQYLKNYEQCNPTGWTVEEYQAVFEKDEHLKDLVSNPFLLRVVLDALPYMENEGQVRSAVQLRLDLYDQFVRQWFKRNEQRLSTQDLTGTKRAIFRELCDEGFAPHGLRLVQELAAHLYTENRGNPVVDYSSLKDNGNWKDAFFGREEEKQLLREAWPLNRSGTQYRFIHKSLLEYFVARALFESFDACIALDIRPRRGSNASVYSFENQSVLPPRVVGDVSLAPKDWVGDLGVVRWLTERVQQEPSFKKQLLAIIERSKTDVDVRQAAANAMTILVRTGVQFNWENLKGIQIPGADLSFGVFDSAQLQGSDLRKANLRSIWLCNANLSGARMAGVQFGEWAYLQEEERLESCAVSPDGQTCAVGLITGLISLYWTSTWEKIHTLERQGGGNSLAYSPSGKQIASGSLYKTVLLWDVESGAPMRALEGHTETVTSVAYSPSGKHIVSGSDDNTVRVWEVENGASVHILEGHTNSVTSVVYSPSGAQIASGSHDNTVRLWEVESGAPVRTLEGHTGSVSSVAYSPSGKHIVSGSDDKTVRVWDVESGASVRTLEGHTSSVASVVYSPSGVRIASGSMDKTVRVWEVESGALVHTLEGHTYPVISVAYLPSGKQLISGSRDKTVRMWEVESEASVHAMGGHTGSVSTVVYSPSGNQITSGSWDSTVRVWEVESGASVHILEGHTNDVTSVVYSPSGAQIASGSHDNTVRMWDVESGAPVFTLEGHTDSVVSVAYSPSGAQIASGSWDNTVRVWEVESGAAVFTLEGHTSHVTSVVYSPSGAQIASGSYDNTVRVWDVESGTVAHILEGHTDWIYSVAYSPSGNQIASGSHDDTVRLWDVESGAVVHALEGHTERVYSVMYSPSGAQIASGSRDNTVRLWDVESGAVVHILEGHTARIDSMAYLPSGAQIASGSWDETVRLWDVTSGECLRVIQGFNGSASSIAWNETPTGSYLVTGGEDKSVRRWEVKKDGSDYKVKLCWSKGPGYLAGKGALIEGVEGLSERNKSLLKQRGALERRIV